MSTVNGFQVGNEVLKYNYESLENYNTPNFSTSSSKQYAVGDYVIYQGKLYKCTTATTGGTWVSGSWELAILSDDLQSLDGEVEELKSAVNHIDGLKVLNFVSGYYITTNVEVGETVNINSPTVSGTGLAYAIDDCTEGNEYTIFGTGANTGRLWAFVDSDSKLLSKAANGVSMFDKVVVAPENSAKIIINAKNAFAVKGRIVYKRLDALEQEAEEKITPNRTSFFTRSTNLFDGTLYVGKLTNTGVLDSAETDYKTTDYLDIRGNDGKYILAEKKNGEIGFWGYGFYDKNKNFISGSTYASSVARQIPTGAYYARLGIVATTNIWPFVGISNDGSAVDYEVYYQFVNAPCVNWYKGKKISALGDSITVNGNYIKNDTSHSAWRQIVWEQLALSDVVQNNGIGGTRVSGSSADAMWQDARITAIASDSDVVLFNGGMNDWLGNAVIGTVDSTDTDTFMGALNVIAQKLLTRFPAKRIFWMTTTYGRQSSDLNTLNLTTRDYAEAIRTIAKKFGFPVIDLAAECGWNEYNYATYLNAENGTYIHPNRTGGQRIAEVIIGRLLQFNAVSLLSWEV